MKLVPLVDHPRRPRPVRWGAVFGWVALCVVIAAAGYFVTMRIWGKPKRTRPAPSTSETGARYVEERIPAPVMKHAPVRPTRAALPSADDRQARALLEEGSRLLEQGRASEADAAFRKVVQDWPDTTEGVQALALLGLAAKEAGSLEEARKLLTRALLKNVDAAFDARIVSALDEINKELVFSPLQTSDSIIHTVASGETPSGIGRRYKVPYESIIRINGIRDAKRIRPGQRLKILQGDFHILVDKSMMHLTLFLNGQYVKRYRVGIGHHDLTPEGDFVIGLKQKDPAWYKPGGGVIPYGHPDNPLGTRWIKLKDTPEFSGYGIHGTTDPKSIGAKMSEGCIRMLNREVEELFDLVPLGTTVAIVK